MSVITVIAFAVGITVGGISCALLTQREWRRVRRETTELLKSSGDIQDSFYAMTDMVHRGALQKLESGDTEGTKQELIGAIANFHQHFKKCGERSRIIATEVREVELQAKTSTILAAAFSKKSDEKTVA